MRPEVLSRLRLRGHCNHTGCVPLRFRLACPRPALDGLAVGCRDFGQAPGDPCTSAHSDGTQLYRMSLPLVSSLDVNERDHGIPATAEALYPTLSAAAPEQQQQANFLSSILGPPGALWLPACPAQHCPFRPPPFSRRRCHSRAVATLALSRMMGRAARDTDALCNRLPFIPPVAVVDHPPPSDSRATLVTAPARAGCWCPSALTLFRHIGILVDADDFLFFSVAAVSRGFFFCPSITREEFENGRSNR